MKNRKRTLTVLTALLFLSLLFVSCKNDGGNDDVNIDHPLIGAANESGSSSGKAAVKIPKTRDIEMDAGSSTRSLLDIEEVIMMNGSDLKHIYNQFLNKQPGFQGTVTLKFSIAPGGEIISISVVSSTTGYNEFDTEIKLAVSHWKFPKVKTGLATVTAPFTFTIE